MEIAIVIMGGGRSNRFGDDKLSYMLDGKPLISRVIDESRKVSDNVYISTTDYEFERLEQIIKEKEVGVIFDDPSLGCEGPLRGIATSIGKIEAEYYLFLPGDVPWIREESLNLLIKYSVLNKILVSPITRSGFVSQLFLVIPSSLRMKVLNICRKYSVLSSRVSNLIRGNDALLVGSFYLTKNPNVFFDVDMKQDLLLKLGRKRIKRIIRTKSSSHFLHGIEMYKKGKRMEAYASFLKEAKYYRSIRIYNLELHCLKDVAKIGLERGREGLEHRIKWLKERLGLATK
ncbi:MAG: nucleotidyltransferase family protein [Caldisphaeraceae archaeon]|nr:nucleotidyltransferase family protein [Caldisphaeraceae archaeon]